MTLPPRPPSPPSGPPMGVRHSRRKEVQPEPPVPPSTVIMALSMNIQRGPLIYCQGGPLILARSGIHKTKAGSFKLSQLHSSELIYRSLRCAPILDYLPAKRSRRRIENPERTTLYAA